MNTSFSRLVAVAGLLACPAAFGQWYAGVAVGPTRIDLNCTGTVVCDRTDSGGKVYAGWRLTGVPAPGNVPQPTWFALEGVYFDWGRARSTSTDAELGDSELKVRARGLGLGLAALMPTTPGPVLEARVGLLYNRARTTQVTPGTSTSSTHGGWFPWVGVGVSYAFAPNWAVTGSADFSRVKYSPQDKAKVQLIAVGLRHYFP